jgi:DEAD/DEAH box helicase domain-containing protein
LYLPLVQCSECHTTGWLSRLPQASNKVSTVLDEIYNTWFSGRPEAVRLYAGGGLKQPQVDGLKQHLCTSCGNLQSSAEQCQACGHNELVAVFRTTGTRSSTRGNLASTWHDNTCPACGGRDRLILLGARNATLGSQVVEQSWASPFNDDKKLIAFSDSVQDAAHRAGFFGARTYANTVRTALTRAIDHLVPEALPWADFLSGLYRLVSEPGAALYMPDAQLVAEFIGPNMTWQRDWADELLGKGALPASSKLPERVRKRLGWQAVSEFTYLSHRGRNLDRIGKATLALPIDDLTQAARLLLPVLREQFGAQGLDERTVLQWLWGFAAHLRQRGAVSHPELGAYARDGKVWALINTQGRGEWMPGLGERTPRPVFLSLGQHRDFDRLSAARQQTWFDRWAAAALGQQMLLAPGMAEPLYLEAIRVLEQLALLQRHNGTLGDTVTLAADRVHLYSKVVQLVSGQGKRRLTVPADAAPWLQGMPCLDATQEHYDEVGEAGGWLVDRFSHADLRRVRAAEHTGLLERGEREALEIRFKSKQPQPWYENLLSATPTLEMGVDIGDLSSVLLCSVPPNQASYLQRIGRAGRRDGNAMTTTLADGSSPHDLYFFEETQEMLSGEVTPPGVFLKAAEVLRRQLFAFCLDDWVNGVASLTALPDKTSTAVDAVEKADKNRFPYTFTDHVLLHEARLLEAFLGLLGDDADDRVVKRLTEFMQGTGDSDGLRLRIIKLLEELMEERRIYRKKAEQLKGQIAALVQKPQDEATREQIDQLRRERDKSLELVKEINQRDLLNTLTDAGLIPNYAFPEAGIELKSVLWRKKGTDDRTEGAYVALPAIKYERPANSALSEFAPENRFYANQRRVEVDQINMGLAKMESWRLCPACHHMENLTLHADAHSTCPRCGEPMWADEAQRRQLLRFRQAIANSDDTKVRIDDSADDREPKFYVRQLLADFEREDIKEAWQLKAADLPFGFEFISRVVFRDVNFGELSKPGDSFKVADKETMRPGFRLCRHCGKVQTPPRRHEEGPAQQHAFDCEKRESDDPANIVDCLYLYREFSSEALRILVPYTSKGVDDEVVQSFMAALQLGLKKRFGGKVDHLRMVTQDEPGKDGAQRRQYVMLYDSVPGGTGYLHQLLTQEAGTLADVLRMALAAITVCSCNQDPEKDGCYRCVYQYRLGRKMELVSRNRASEVLTELVGALDHLEKVPTISDIYINPNFDSALEARFIESLRRLGGVNGLPPVKLVQDIVNGKSGFLLELGSQRYWVELQHDIGPMDGVAVPSRPDFVIWPAQSASPRRAIAVYCDGWAYHKDSLRADARKRSAIVASGRYWAWSVTHEDVKAALAGDIQTDLDSPLTTLTRHAGQAAPPSLPRAENQAFSRNAVAQLLGWLARDVLPDEDPALLQLQRNVGWLTFLMVPAPKSADSQKVQALWSAMLPKLPQWMHDLPGKHIPAVSREAVEPQVMYAWPASLASGKLTERVTPGLLILDDEDRTDEKATHLHWRRWLALFNALQVLPGLVMTTRSAIDGGDLAELDPVSHKGASANDQGAAQASAWKDAVDSALVVVQEGMRQLATAGLVPPSVGYEHVDERGEIVAEAELAWPAHRLAVMMSHQLEYTPFWTGAGWTAISVDGDWVAAVLAHMAN